MVRLIFALVLICTYVSDVFGADVSDYVEHDYVAEEFNKLPSELQNLISGKKLRVRIKDIVNFEGIRDNILVGYGLVVGLNGSGDNVKNFGFTQRELENFLSKLGVNTKGVNINTRNTAAVTVTAVLHPFTRTGTKISVQVSAIGDARSLAGGVLLATPLLGADGMVYAVAQGMIVTGNYGDGEQSRKKSYTSGYISDGAIVEKDVNFVLASLTEMKLNLRNPDIGTAHNIEESINSNIGDNLASAIDPATIVLNIPQGYPGGTIGFLNDIETLIVKVDVPARIVIDSRTGTIVITEDVRISKVAISTGSLEVRIGGDKGMNVVNGGVSLKELVSGLNAIGVSAKELTDIIQNIKGAGAIQAEVIVR